MRLRLMVPAALVAAMLVPVTAQAAEGVSVQVSQTRIETKLGKSPYTTKQQLKDYYLFRVSGYRVDLVRGPSTADWTKEGWW